jgi:hypothetical protein
VNRTPVTSDMLCSVGYDSATGTLEVEFRSGAVYEYVDVPCDHYNALLAASSKGRFFNARVRAAFRFRRVA